MTTHTSKHRIMAVVSAGALAAGLALGTVAPASAATQAAPAAAPTATAAAPTARSTAVVKAWYHQFLGRSASADAGSRYWVGQLDAGVAPADVLSRLLRSPEYVRGGVAAIYRAYLDRAPDRGAQSWVDGVVEGRFPLEWVEQNVASSTEYQLLRGDGASGSATKIVGGWYRVVLGRAPSAGEVAYWTSRQSAVGVLAAFRELWYAPEAVQGRIQGHYVQFLERGPALVSPGELAYWYDREVASDITVKVAIASSDEYRARAGA